MNIVLIGRNPDKTERVAQEIRKFLCRLMQELLIIMMETEFISGSIYNVLAKVIVVDLAKINSDDVKNVQEQLRGLPIAILSKLRTGQVRNQS